MYKTKMMKEIKACIEKYAFAESALMSRDLLKKSKENEYLNLEIKKLNAEINNLQRKNAELMLVASCVGTLSDYLKGKKCAFDIIDDNDNIIIPKGRDFGVGHLNKILY